MQKSDGRGHPGGGGQGVKGASRGSQAVMVSQRIKVYVKAVPRGPYGRQGGSRVQGKCLGIQRVEGGLQGCEGVNRYVEGIPWGPGFRLMCF